MAKTTKRAPSPALSLYNTERRKKEIFSSLEEGQVRMYTCGPTVYHYAHIGNFRTYVFEDLLRRALQFFGYRVTQVVNLTDVDDKTIQGAIQANQTLLQFTEPFKKAFFEDIEALHIEKAEHYPAATAYISQMISCIQILLDKGVAYVAGDRCIYYSISKYPAYGRLSHLKLDELRAGAGHACIAADEYDKENVGDFVLWKAYDPDRDKHVFWESPFGKGRPGWHIECSTMAMHLLGNTIDIHAGAVDNIFPHHENEIAQSEAISGKPFVKYWLHAEHLLVQNKKMSKSLGNFYTLRDILQKGFTGLEVRYLLLQTHYRTKLNFTFEGLEGAKTALRRLHDFLLRMQELAGEKESSPLSSPIRELVDATLACFTAAIADDLNTSIALASLFDLMSAVNGRYERRELGAQDAAAVVALFYSCNRVLGIWVGEQQEVGPSPHLQIMLEKREEARKGKQWGLADELRDEILKAGYVIEDTPKGARLKKK